jgi:hypothetical protein
MMNGAWINCAYAKGVERTTSKTWKNIEMKNWEKEEEEEMVVGPYS